MRINQTKTKIVHFRKLQNPKTNATFKCGEVNISVDTSYKYLGCKLTENLDYTATADLLSEAASRSLGSIINKLKSSNGMYLKTFTTLYDKCVVSISDLNSGVWGFKEYATPNNIHHRAIRSFLGVHRNTSLVVLNGDIGWTPPIVRRKLNIIRLWYRLEMMDNHRLPKLVYLWDSSVTGRSWTKDVHSILQQVNVADTSMGLRTILSQAKLYLMNNYIADWQKTLQDQPKLRLYRTFKHEYGTEDYVMKYLPPYLRSILAQFRAGILPLEVELGRFRQKPLHERLCTLCDTGEIEDETHFVFRCGYYLNLRLTFLDSIYRDNMNFHELTHNEQLQCLMKKTYKAICLLLV